jgi:hypothetical protein
MVERGGSAGGAGDGWRLPRWRRAAAAASSSDAAMQQRESFRA